MSPHKFFFKQPNLSIAPVLAVLLVLLTLPANGQERPSRISPILAEIIHSFDEGKISLDEKIVYLFQAISEPRLLPDTYGNTGREFIKCGTPPFVELYNHRNRLSPSTLSKLEPYTTRPALASEQTYLSESGKFQLHYTTSGEDSVRSADNNNNGVSDYVERTAEAADSSWNHMAGNLGYTDPVTGAGSPYDIYFVNFAFNYGRTISDGNTTYIEIHSTFEDFPPNTDPEGDVIGAMKVTVAHELKHAIQYANNRWQGSAGSFGWIEMDATLMEEVVYDNVNDYYNYIYDSSSIFLSPESSLPGAYWDMTWSLYFEEQFGSEFWVQVWKDIKKNPRKNFLSAIQKQLDNNGDLFYRHFSESHLWHYASGTNFSAAGFGFEERMNYPDPSITITIDGKTETLQNSQSLAPLAANYIQIRPTGTESDQVLIRLRTDSIGLAAGALAYFKDGTVQTWHGLSNTNGDLILETTWDWNSIQEIGLVTVNTTQSRIFDYTIKTASYGAPFATLHQNYPNPFNPGTTIRFTLQSPTQITLRVYDINGRLVRTLANGNYPAGPHEIDFNAENLASGIYFYHLTSDRKRLGKKMLLIK